MVTLNQSYSLSFISTSYIQLDVTTIDIFLPPIRSIGDGGGYRQEGKLTAEGGGCLALPFSSLEILVSGHCRVGSRKDRAEWRTGQTLTSSAAFTRSGCFLEQTLGFTGASEVYQEMAPSLMTSHLHCPGPKQKYLYSECSHSFHNPYNPDPRYWPLFAPAGSPLHEI